MGEIFANITTIGQLHHASIEVPPPSDEERELEEDFISSGIHVDKEKFKTTGHHKASTILGDRCAKKDTKAMQFESCLEVWSQSLSARTEAHKARAKKYKHNVLRQLTQFQILNPLKNA